MAYNIEFGLSKKGISNAKHMIKNLKKELNSSTQKINKNIADKCADKMLSYHDIFISALDEDAYNHSAMTRVIEKNKSAEAIIYGEQVIYDEFGTADTGARNAHPEHSKYGMNNYSSGPYVSTHQDDYGHYWIFNRHKMYGVPAGKFFYNTLMDMKNGEAKHIAKEVVDETLRKTLGGDK